MDDTVLGIGEGDEDGEEASHADGRNEIAVGVDRVHRHRSLAHMDQSLDEAIIKARSIRND